MDCISGYTAYIMYRRHCMRVRARNDNKIKMGGGESGRQDGSHEYDLTAGFSITPILYLNCRNHRISPSVCVCVFVRLLHFVHKNTSRSQEQGPKLISCGCVCVCCVRHIVCSSGMVWVRARVCDGLARESKKLGMISTVGHLGVASLSRLWRQSIPCGNCEPSFLGCKLLT